MGLFSSKKSQDNTISPRKFFKHIDDNIDYFNNHVTSERRSINGIDNDLIYIPGNRNKPLIYFVHGLGATYRLFYEGLVYFHRQGYSVLTHSRRGEIAGIHDNIDITLNLMVDDLDFALNSFKPKQVHIIASSFGGILSLLLAERNAKKIASVTTIGSFLKFPWNLAHDILFDLVRTVKVDKVPVLELGPLAPQIRFIRQRSEKVMRYVLTEYETFPLSTVAKYLAILKGLDFAHKPPKVSAAKLFIHGREDDMVPVACLDVMAGAYKDADTMVLEKVGHGPFLSKPAVLYEPIVNLINATS